MLFTHDDGGDGSQGFQMLGMMNALKTGDVHTDMIIAMCVPFVLKMLFSWVGKLEDIFDWEYFWERWFEKKTVEHERFISHSTTTTSWGGRRNTDEDAHNSILLKAIKLYLHQVVKLDLMSAYLDLTGLDDKNYDGYHDCYDSDDDDSTSDADCKYGSQKTLAGQLSRYKIVKRLPNNEWHEIGTYGDAQGVVRLCIEHQTKKKGDAKEDAGDIVATNGNSGSSNNIQNTTFHFISPEKGAIDAFIDTAYKWYLQELRKIEDNSRYYYEMKLPEIKIGRNNNDDNGGSEGITYKRYKLSEEKSFESLFFREKDSLLALINHFTAKTGKYSIKGYPHKLGVLLHGPPGTGKTSLIKALAQYTGRSIVNVPLSRVSTNSELMSVFFDRKYHVEGAYVPVKLGFKDVIFVMEDCDAASKVVKRRDGQRPAELHTPESVTLPTPKSIFRLLLESTSAECEEVVKSLIERSERLKATAEKERPSVLCSLARRVNLQPALGLVDESTDDPVIAQACIDAFEMAAEMKDHRSKLDDILNSYAEAIKKLLDSGAEVSDEFVDELLGETCSLGSPYPLIGKAGPSAPRGESSGNKAGTTTPYANAVSFDPTSGNGDEKFSGFGPSLFKPNPDALSLSGLLNILDGVVDSPGRIVILTSNHPELLDPALIRPGRVDKTILLGLMDAPDIVQMLELYYQTTLTDKQVARIGKAVDGPKGDTKYKLKLTPAQIEQLAAEHDDLDSMICTLEEKSPSANLKTNIVEADSNTTARA